MDKGRRDFPSLLGLRGEEAVHQLSQNASQSACSSLLGLGAIERHIDSVQHLKDTNQISNVTIFPLFRL